MQLSKNSLFVVAGLLLVAVAVSLLNAPPTKAAPVPSGTVVVFDQTFSGFNSNGTAAIDVSAYRTIRVDVLSSQFNCSVTVLAIDATGGPLVAFLDNVNIPGSCVFTALHDVPGSKVSVQWIVQDAGIPVRVLVYGHP